jgi:hypothetical protein
MDWRNFFSIISGWIDGWLSFSPSIWMDDFFLHHLGWMFSSAAVRSLFSLSLSLLPLLSRLCVAVHCSDLIFCNVFDASLPKICHCLLLFVAVFFFSPPTFFSFCWKILICFRFGAAIVGGLVSFWSGVEKEPQEFVLLQGKNSNNKENKENNVHCPFFVSDV